MVVFKNEFIICFLFFCFFFLVGGRERLHLLLQPLSIVTRFRIIPWTLGSIAYVFTIDDRSENIFIFFLYVLDPIIGNTENTKKFEGVQIGFSIIAYINKSNAPHSPIYYSFSSFFL